MNITILNFAIHEFEKSVGASSFTCGQLKGIFFKVRCMETANS